MGAGQIKLTQTSGGMKRGRREEEEKKKKTAGFFRGSQSVACLMKFLEEVPSLLQHEKTQNHSAGGRNTEEAERGEKKERQKMNYLKRLRLRETAVSLLALCCCKKHFRDFSPFSGQNTLEVQKESDWKPHTCQTHCV